MGKMLFGITITISLFVSRDHFIVPKYKPRQIVLMMANMRKFQFTWTTRASGYLLSFFIRYFVAKQLPGLVQWCLNLSAIQTVWWCYNGLNCPHSGNIFILFQLRECSWESKFLLHWGKIVYTWYFKINLKNILTKFHQSTWIWFS